MISTWNSARTTTSRIIEGRSIPSEARRLMP
jgi:hypothetical protein